MGQGEGTNDSYRRRGALAAACLLAALAALATLSPRAGAVQITEFTLPKGSAPLLITAGPDGNMWFTDRGTNSIGRITMAGETASYNVGLTLKADLTGIVTGPDGNLWFTQRLGRRVGRITTSGVVTEFTHGLTGTPDIFGIAAGPDGNMWFTETVAARVGRISPTTGTIKEFPIPAGTYTGIVAGPDGNIWMTSVDKGTLLRVTPAGTSKAFGPLSKANCSSGAAAPCPYPEHLTVGRDGNIWFSQTRGDAIGRITMAGNIAEYSNGLTRGSGAAGIAAGPDGNVWFAQRIGQIGRITPQGVITEYSTGLTAKGRPYGIALGPDQNMWVTELDAGKIARVIPDVPPIVSTGGTLTRAQRSAGVSGAVRSRGAATSYYFQYGTTPAYGRRTASVDNGAGDDTVTVRARLRKLAPGRRYHYRIVADNAHGTAVGQDMTVTARKDRRGKLNVKPFKFYFAGSYSRGALRLSQVNVIDLKRGRKVSFRCKKCGGSPTRGSARSKRRELRFRARLRVTGNSTMVISVKSGNGSKRVRRYGFRPRQLGHFLKKEACFLGKQRVSCGAKKKRKKKRARAVRSSARPGSAG